MRHVGEVLWPHGCLPSSRRGFDPRHRLARPSTKGRCALPVRFQVDPDFYDHPKSIGLSDAATALWCRAGSYSAAKLSDGFIAEHALALLSRLPEEASAELVARGLWRRVRGGFQFHQWDHRNLLKAEVESDRESDRARKAAKRAEAKAQAEAHLVRADSAGNPGGRRTESGRSPKPSVSSSVSVSESDSASGRRRGHATGKRHEFDSDGSGSCATCGLPRQNKVHPAA